MNLRVLGLGIVHHILNHNSASFLINMNVLNVNKILQREDGNKHIYFPFLLNDDFESLTIKMEYSPDNYGGEELIEEIKAAFLKVGLTQEISVIREKYLPVNNLLTLSLDGPKGVIGNAHRHSGRASFVIGKSYSSPGFSPVEITRGKYAVCISTHCIASPEVALHLEVVANKK